MFKRSKRLTRAAFPAALTGGKRIFSKNFSVALPKNGEGYAVVVSKKSFRLSTRRHRIKRRVLGALRDIPLPPTAIVFPKKGAEELTHIEIKEELQKLLT